VVRAPQPPPAAQGPLGDTGDPALGGADIGDHGVAEVELPELFQQGREGAERGGEEDQVAAADALG
jgi:hypothetical protein